MRFLTRAWAAGEFSDEEADAALAAYHARRVAVLPQLPRSLRTFAETVDIHDGRLLSVRLDRRARTLQLLLRCGDLQQGYFDLDLTYRGVRLDRLDVALLEVIAWDAKSEALYLEEDVVEPGWYVHRWLWWPFWRELDVEFSGLEFRREARPDRSFVRAEPPFVESSSPAV